MSGGHSFLDATLFIMASPKFIHSGNMQLLATFEKQTVANDWNLVSGGHQIPSNPPLSHWTWIMLKILIFF